MERLIMYTDGGARGNPGRAAIGVVIRNGKGETLKSFGEAIGEATNNEAEYQAVIGALKKAKQLFGKEKLKKMAIEFRMDSELVAEQLSGRYKVENQRIQQLFISIWNMRVELGKMLFTHVPRSENTEADRLVNEALDREQQNLF